MLQTDVLKSRTEKGNLESTLALLSPVFIAFLVFLSCFLAPSTDLFFLYCHGQYIVEEASIPYTEFMSMHEGLDFVMQQWLFAPIVYLSIECFGMLGAGLVIVIGYSILNCAIFATCLIFSKKNYLASYIITAIAAFFLIGFHDIRPQMISMLIILLAIASIEKFIQTNQKKWLVCLPLLSALLVNMHASFWLMLPIAMLPYIVDAALPIRIGRITGRGKGILSFIVVFIAVLVAGLANPYGIDGALYLFGSFGVEQIDETVSEMGTIFQVGAYIYLPLLIGAPAAYIVKKIKDGTDVPVRHMLLIAGMWFLAFLHIKGFGCFIVSSVIPFAIAWERKNGSIATHIEKKTSDIVGAIILSLAILGLAAFAFIMNIQAFAARPTVQPAVEAVLEDDEYDVDDTVYTGYDDGSYAEFRGLRVYLDARAEVFLKANNHKEDIFIEYYDVQKKTIDFQEFIDKYCFDYVIVQKADALYEFMEDSSQYKKIYDSDDDPQMPIICEEAVADYDNPQSKHAVYKRIVNDTLVVE